MGCAQSKQEGDGARVKQGAVAAGASFDAPARTAADAPDPRAELGGAGGARTTGAAQREARELERKVSLIREAVGELPGICVEMIEACLHEQRDDVERAVNVLLDGSYAASLSSSLPARSGLGGMAGWRRPGPAKHSQGAVAAATASQREPGVWTAHLHIASGRRYFFDHASPGSESIWRLPPGAMADAVDEEEVEELADYLDALRREPPAATAPALDDGAAGPADEPETVVAILANLDYATSVRLAMLQSRRHAAALARLAPGAAEPSGPAGEEEEWAARAAAGPDAAAGAVSSLRHAERFPHLFVEQLAVDGQHAAAFRSAGASAAAGVGAGACTDVCVGLAIALFRRFARGGEASFVGMLCGGDGADDGALGVDPPEEGERAAPHGSQPHAITGGARGGAAPPPPRCPSASPGAAQPPPRAPPSAPFGELRRLVRGAIAEGTRVYSAQGARAQMHFVEEALRLAELHGAEGAGGVRRQRPDVLFNLPVTCDDAQPLSLGAFCETLREAADGAAASPVCALVVAERTAWTVLLLFYADCALCVDPHGAEGQAVVVALRGPADERVRMSAEALQLVSARPIAARREAPARPRVWLDPLAGQTEVTLLALGPHAGKPEPALRSR